MSDSKIDPPATIARSLSVSIVTYKPDLRLLALTLASLQTAALSARLRDCSITVIDNDGTLDDAFIASALTVGDGEPSVPARRIAGHGNIGYGRGHNLAIEKIDTRYHLILNPDVDLAPDALDQALDFLEKHPEVGLLAPRVADEHGVIQFLCRRYPSVFDLFVRGFLPSRVRAIFAVRLARYEMRDILGEGGTGKSRSEKGNGQPVDAVAAVSGVIAPPIVSGCFMLFRTPLLKQLGGFDPRYFLYFEDYDLSLRTAKLARIAYVPTVRIVHFGGGAARKGWLHVRMFLTSAFKFFNRFGWRWF